MRLLKNMKLLKQFISNIKRDFEASAYYRLSINDFPADKIFKLSSQKDMIEKSILEYDECNQRYDVTKTFEIWCQKNLKGFYRIWGFGNGYGNHDQIGHGICTVEVRCMRPSDIAMLKLFYQ